MAEYTVAVVMGYLGALIVLGVLVVLVAGVVRAICLLLHHGEEDAMG